MAEKSLVNDVTETEPLDPDPAPADVVVVDVELLLEQALAMSPPTSSIATNALLVLSFNVNPPGLVIPAICAFEARFHGLANHVTAQ
jgi:hypothetical protein